MINNFFHIQRLKEWWLPLIIIFVATLFTFKDILNIFFQQDEWLGFGLMIGYGWESIFSRYGETGGFHFVPLVLTIDYLLFQLFGLNYKLYNLIGFTIHFINGFLVYLILKNLLYQFKNEYQRITQSILGGIFFVTSSVASQLVTWPVININALSLTLALISWLILLKSQKKKTFKNLARVLSLLTILSLLIVEYSAGLILFIPIAFLVLFKDIKEGKKDFLFNFFTPILGYFIVRFIFSFFVNLSKSDNSTNINILQLFFFPFRYLGQILFPEKVILEIASLFSNSDFIVENQFFVPITVLLGLIIFSLIIYILFKDHSDNNPDLVRQNQSLYISQQLILPLAFILCSFLPYFFLVINSVNFHIIPPRYLYFGSAGISILIILVIGQLMIENKKIMAVVVISMVFLFIFFNIFNNRILIKTLLENSIKRQYILEKIRTENPRLPQKVIFYIESDKSYYGVPFNIPPFQSGLGQTLLVWFNDQENFPKDFFKEKFLWELENQGYKEVKDRGFGYFIDFETLNRELKNNNLNSDFIIAYKFHDNSQLDNITEEVRKKLNE